MNKWDNRFMDMTNLVSTWSSCIRRQVGAIIVRDKRILTQPLEFPSAGSVFRNPEAMFAGELIEKCNLKGYVHLNIHFSSVYNSQVMEAI